MIDKQRFIEWLRNHPDVYELKQLPIWYVQNAVASLCDLQIEEILDAVIEVKNELIQKDYEERDTHILSYHPKLADAFVDTMATDPAIKDDDQGSNSKS